MTVVEGRFVFGRGEHCIFCREGNVQILGMRLMNSNAFTEKLGVH
jgi:hypothetical protein